jgi:hypothetical protein
MGDAYTDFTNGVPNMRSSAGASMFDRQGMNLNQMEGLARNRLAAKSAILETRNRMEMFREKERARIEAPRAMQGIAQLDPENDPDYDAKVVNIVRQNPSAMSDDGFNRVLGLQGNVFQRRDNERRSNEAFDRQTQAYETRDNRLAATREQERLEAAKWKMSEDDQKELNSLYELGLNDEEVADLIDDNGRVNRKKKAMAIGRMNRDKATQKAELDKASAEMKERTRLLAEYKAYDEANDDVGKAAVSAMLERLSGVIRPTEVVVAPAPASGQAAPAPARPAPAPARPAPAPARPAPRTPDFYFQPTE